MTEDEVYVSELLVVEAAHKLEQEGAVEVIQMLAGTIAPFTAGKFALPTVITEISQVNATNR
jgi:hypothetical protein